MELDPKSGFIHGWGSSLIFLFVTKICVPSTIFSIITFDWVIKILLGRVAGGGGVGRGVQLPTLTPPITPMGGRESKSMGKWEKSNINKIDLEKHWQ